MGSQKVLGRVRGEHEQYRPARTGRAWQAMSCLAGLRIRTRFFLGLALLTLVAVAGGLVGFLSLTGMNRLLEAKHVDDRAMVGQLAETRSRLAEAVNGLGQLRDPGDAETLSGGLSHAEQAA